jgi:hypothetical protein
MVGRTFDVLLEKKGRNPGQLSALALASAGPM